MVVHEKNNDNFCADALFDIVLLNRCVCSRFWLVAKLATLGRLVGWHAVIKVCAHLVMVQSAQSIKTHLY